MRSLPVSLLYRRQALTILAKAVLFSDATGLDILWFGVDKLKSKLDPVYPI
jgi:hypothetical protein